MHSVAEALEIVLKHVKPLPAETMAVTPQSLGLVLAEDIASDLDMPPFDKAMMDGFALRTSDLRGGQAELTIVEEIHAGKTPTIEVKAGQSSRIMTGAPIPIGTDAVVMIERCAITGDKVRVNDPTLESGKNIMPQGREMRLGEIVLRAGARLRPQEIGLLASVGRPAVKTYPAPRVAILSTGDELVTPSEKPGVGQIRNSNGPMLMAQVERAGGLPNFLGIARDEPDHLRELIAQGLQADVLILSGGVSAGKLDLVPGMLAEHGVKAIFHKVAMKPGKPILFGIKAPPHPLPLSRDGERGDKLVFGLPGNPVSTLVGFELFVRPALRGMMGLTPGPCWVKATLTKDYPFRTDRPTYHPAHLQLTDTGWSVVPMPWFGSPDLRSITTANAFALLPEGDHEHRASETLSVLRVEND